MHDPKPAVALESVSKRVGAIEALTDVCLALSPGRITALLGPNGAGKTTAVRTMTGLLRPDCGRVVVFDTEMTRANADELRVHFGVQSDGNLYDSLTVQDNLDTFGRLAGLPTAERGSRIGELLALFGLDDRRQSVVGALSKGLRQRVAIARALIGRPEVLLLDEPSAGLDPASVRDLYQLITQLRDDFATAVLICTHQLEGVQKVADNVAILRRGKVLASGRVQDVIQQRWPYTVLNLQIESDGVRTAAAVGAASLPFVSIDHQSSLGDEDLSVELRDTADVPNVISALTAAGARILEARRWRPGLEDLYFDVIGEGE